MAIVSSRVGLERNGFIEHQVFQFQDLVESLVQIPIQQFSGFDGNDLWCAVPAVNEGIQREFNKHVKPNKYFDNYNSLYNTQTFPHRHQDRDSVFSTSSWMRSSYPNGKTWQTNGAVFRSLVSKNDQVGAADTTQSCYPTVQNLVPVDTHMQTVRSPRSRMYHQIYSKNVKIPRCNSAFEPIQPDYEGRFLKSIHETKQSHGITNCTIPQYSKGFENDRPQARDFFHEVWCGMNGGQSFHDPFYSGGVNQTGAYPDRDESLAYMHQQSNQYSIQYQYPPGLKGKVNSQNIEHNFHHRNSSAYQCGEELPNCYEHGKSYCLKQASNEDTGLKHNYRVRGSSIYDSEVVTNKGTLGCSEIASKWRKLTAECSSSRYKGTTSSLASQEIPILKIATILPRPSSKQPDKTKSQFSAYSKPLTQCQRQGSMSKKSFDFGEHEQDDLLNAPIFQILCELSEA